MSNLYIGKTGNNKKIKEALQNISLPTALDYDTLASEVLSVAGDINSLINLMPYLSTDKVDELVKGYVEDTNSFCNVYNVYKYMSTKGIDDIVKSHVDATGDFGIISSILQFMSEDGSNYIARKYINESKNQQLLHLFTPYLK